MGQQHSVHISAGRRVPQSKCHLPYHEQINLRMADDGKYYSRDDFREFYGYRGCGEDQERWEKAPQYLERRKENNGIYQNATYFFSRYGGGGHSWTRYYKPGWDTAIQERRLADDGRWYTIQEFQQHYSYSGDWERRWSKAPIDDELRYSPEDNQAHDALWFFRRNESSTWGTKWDINSKYGWDTASKAPTSSSLASAGIRSPIAQMSCQISHQINNTYGKERRLADDGIWYTFEEFQKFYPGKPDYWENAPKEFEMRIENNDYTNQPHDAKWFYDTNKMRGGSQWSRNYKGLWAEARPYSAGGSGYGGSGYHGRYGNF